MDVNIAIRHRLWSVDINAIDIAATIDITLILSHFFSGG